MTGIRGVVVALVLGLAGLLGLLTGCGATDTAPGGSRTAASTIATPQATPHAVTPLPAAEPAVVRIAAIGVTSTLIPLGLNSDNTVEVPPIDKPMQAGWYRYGPTPGEQGPAVILGHVDGGGRDGVFARLNEMTPGDDVVVTRKDGSVAVFDVTRVQQVPKSAFPTEEVYGNTEAAELRLITCGGTFDETRDSYRDNIIVYATLGDTR